MCGILGTTGTMSMRISDADFYDALDLIRHRGPDGDAVWFAPDIRLGHRRLAIIDLDERAGQPMHQGELTIVFNGEIYNFRELRSELQALGCTFKTTSDTEVLLQSWKRWGPDCLIRIEGMFAFALWDNAQKKIYLARDRYGEKPLFVYENNRGISFASEMPPLIRLAGSETQENRSATGLFFLFSYIPAPYGALQGISQLEPGCWMEWSVQSGVQRHQYYTLQKEVATASIQPQHTYDECCSKLRSILYNSVRKRIETADVPVASLLSGGIDSSIITILAAQSKVSNQPMSVYSLGFPEDSSFDETDFARAVIETLPNVKHHIVEATEDSVMQFSDQVIEKIGEPYADASILPTSLLCSKVEEKVALGGDGADEVFAGYGIYPAIVAGSRIPDLIKRGLSLLPHHPNPHSLHNSYLRAAALFHYHLRATPIESYLSWRSYANLDSLTALGLDISAIVDFCNMLNYNNIGSLRELQLLDLAFNLPNDMLKKVDHAAMLHSLEIRLPFLDSTLVHWALSLPDKYRIHRGIRKRILRDSFANDLPEIILKRSKKGFLLPIRQWFRTGKLRDELDAMLSTQSELDRNVAHAILNEHVAGHSDHSVLLWSLYVYLRWLSRISVWIGHRRAGVKFE